MEETKKAYIVDLNKLKALDEYGNVVSPHLYGGAEKAILGYVYKDGELVKVYNQAEYVFKAETDMEVDCAAITLDPVTASYKCDYNSSTKTYSENRTDVAYEGTIYLPANPTDEEITGELTVTQPKSGLSITCRYTQGANAWTGTYAYSNMNFYGASYEQMGAGGGTSYLVVTVSVYRQEIWGSGLMNGETIYPSFYFDENGYLHSINGLEGVSMSLSASAVSGTNSSVNSSTGVVYGYDWYQTEFGGGAIANATNIRVYFDGMTAWSNDVYSCIQEANVEEISSESYYVNIIADNDSSDDISISADITEVYIYLQNAYVSRIYQWTSGAPSDKGGTESVTASLNASGGSLDVSRLDVGEQAILTIPANTTGNEKTYTVTAYAGDTSDIVYITQEKSETMEYWKTPSATAIIVGDIPANGEAINVVVRYNQDYVRYDSASGTETVIDSIIGGSVTVDSISGSGSAYVSGGYISANDLEDNETARTQVYTIWGVTFTANGVSGSYSSSTTVHQEANVKETFTEYSISSLSANPSSGISALGGTSIITIGTVVKVETTEWTSQYPTSPTTTYLSAKLSTDAGTLDTTTVSSGGTSKLTLLGTTSPNGRTVTVTATAGDYSRICTVTQNAATYELESYLEPDIAETAGTYQWIVKSIRNGMYANTITASVSGIDGASVSVSTASDYGTGYYAVNITVPANLTDEERDVTVNVVQSYSGKELTGIFTQSAGQSDSRTAMLVGGDAAYASSDKSSIAATLLFDARNTDLYKGGTVSSVSAWISTSDGSGGSTVGSVQNVGNVSVSEGSYTTRTLTWSRTSGYSALYLHVRYDSTKEYVVQVEEYMPEG